MPHDQNASLFSFCIPSTEHQAWNIIYMKSNTLKTNQCNTCLISVFHFNSYLPLTVFYEQSILYVLFLILTAQTSGKQLAVPVLLPFSENREVKHLHEIPQLESSRTET